MTWEADDTAVSLFIPSTESTELRLHLRSCENDPSRLPVLFIHGATYASRLYDVPYPGASWLKATAKAGFAAYALDIRGYGKSQVVGLEEGNVPYASSKDALSDIGDAVAWLCAYHNSNQVGLVGGSWGSITTAMFAASTSGAQVAALILYAPIFAEENPNWLPLLADPLVPSKFNPLFRAVRYISEASSRARWDAEIPEGEKWYEESVFQSLLHSSFADDPYSLLRDPPAFLAPNGCLLDLWEAFNARPLYDPKQILCPTLLLRASADTTSTRSDALSLFDLLGAKKKRYCELAHGGHNAIAEKLGPQLFSVANAFFHEALSE